MVTVPRTRKVRFANRHDSVRRDWGQSEHIGAPFITALLPLKASLTDLTECWQHMPRVRLSTDAKRLSTSAYVLPSKALERTVWAGFAGHSNALAFGAVLTKG